MDIRLIAFDLDGTLLRSDKSISPRTMQALLAARERGVLLVPSTGRLLRSLPEPLLDKSLTRYHILVNGAQVYDSFEDKTLLREELTPQQAMCMLHFLKSRNVLRGVYIDGLGHMSRKDFSEIEAVAATPATAALMRRSYQTDEDLDAVTAQHDSVQKIIAFFRNPDDKQATIREITSRFPGYAVSSSLGNNIEINAQNATKGSALCFLCEKIGVPIGQCMAFGDGTNDYSMLRAAGFGVAMGNASEEVQSCADAVTETNEEDGVARMIERVLGL